MAHSTTRTRGSALWTMSHLRNPRHPRLSDLPKLMKTRFWLAATLVFAAITIIAYLPAFLGKVPFPRDMILQFAAWNNPARSEPLEHYADIGDLVTAFYPSRVLVDRAMRDGAFPLWNPHFLGGAPFLASPQSSMFYPP